MDMQMGGGGTDPEAEMSRMLDDAEKGGKLADLQAVMDENGWMPAKEFVRLAQKDERLRGKAPSEMAEMLRGPDGDALYEDVSELRPGGSLDKMEGMKPKGPPPFAKKTEEESDEFSDKDDLDTRMQKMRKKAPPFGDEGEE